MAETVARDFVKELEAALQAQAATLHGFQQLERTQVDNPADAEAIRGAIALRDRRKKVLDTALAATIALLDDDYPKVPRIIVSAEVLKDIKQNLADQETAFAEFMTEKPPDETAAKLNTTLAPPEPRVPKSA